MDHYLSGCCLLVVFAVLSGIVRRAGDGVICERWTALDTKMAVGVIRNCPKDGVKTCVIGGSYETFDTGDP